MTGIVACEKMLGKLNSRENMIKEQWDSFSDFKTGGDNVNVNGHHLLPTHRFTF